MVFWEYKVRNSIRINEGLDNGDSDNQGPTVIHLKKLQFIQACHTM